MNDSIYRPPEAKLEHQEPLPANFVKNPSLPSTKLVRAGWLAVLYTILNVVIIVLTFTENTQSGILKLVNDVLTLASTAIWVYIILLFKALLNLRFNNHSCDRIITILIFLSIPLSALMLMVNMEEMNTITLIYFALFVPYGIVIFLLGKKIGAIKTRYPGLKLYAWSSMFGGICIASILLITLSAPAMLLNSIAGTMILFHAAKELKEHNEHA